MAGREISERRIETSKRIARPLKLTRSLRRNQIKLLCSEIIH